MAQQPVIQVATPQPRLDSGALVLSELLAQGPFLRKRIRFACRTCFLEMFLFRMTFPFFTPKESLSVSHAIHHDLMTANVHHIDPDLGAQ